jgi:hypothetical protein
MAAVITELTQDQKEQMPVYRDRAIANALRTDEADWAQAEACVIKMLAAANIEVSEVLRASGPIQAAREGHAKAHALDGTGGRTLFQSSYYGSSVARNNFFCEVAGVELDKTKEGHRKVLSNFVSSCGGAYLHSEFAIIYDRPSVLHIAMTGGTGVLHCEDGPAIAWGRGEDGLFSPEAENSVALYYWQGTKVPKSWIMEKPTTPRAMSERAAEVLGTSNQEALRAGCEILGWVPVLESLGMKVLDQHENPAFGRLVTVDLPDAPGTKFLVAECGTGRTIAVLADPDATTAFEAGAASYGVPVKVYKKLKYRT